MSYPLCLNYFVTFLISFHQKQNNVQDLFIKMQALLPHLFYHLKIPNHKLKCYPENTAVNSKQLAQMPARSNQMHD